MWPVWGGPVEKAARCCSSAQQPKPPNGPNSYRDPATTTTHAPARTRPQHKGRPKPHGRAGGGGVEGPLEVGANRHLC